MTKMKWDGPLRSAKSAENRAARAERIAIYLTDAEYDKLNELCVKHERTMSDILRLAFHIAAPALSKATAPWKK